MEKGKFFSFVRAYLKSRISAILFGLFSGFFIFLVYYLYHLPWGAVGYCLLFLGTVGLAVLLSDGARTFKKWHILFRHKGQYPLGELPAAFGPVEQMYDELLGDLDGEYSQMLKKMGDQVRDAGEYYTLWIHQIKTPIAAMRLLLDVEEEKGNDGETVFQLRQELFRVEQYAEMALQYQRLSSMEGDLSFACYPVEVLVKKALKRCAPLFIYQKLSLELLPISLKWVTDEKWLCFVLEQLLTNAAKYTPQGVVRVYAQGENELVIEDTGIGISKEDLPRVFERGFTGTAGRVDGRATGLGLYLSREITQKLGLSLRMESVLGKGTRAVIAFKQTSLLLE